MVFRFSNFYSKVFGWLYIRGQFRSKEKKSILIRSLAEIIVLKLIARETREYFSHALLLNTGSSKGTSCLRLKGMSEKGNVSIESVDG